jgi:hypothetical protein
MSKEINIDQLKVSMASISRATEPTAVNKSTMLDTNRTLQSEQIELCKQLDFSKVTIKIERRIVFDSNKMVTMTTTWIAYDQ